MRDTTMAAERMRVAAIRAQTPAERLRHAIDLSEAARKLALAGLRTRYPALSDLEIVALYAGYRLPHGALPRGQS
ncbi:MAG: hypothetical protein ACREOG_21900 [Gemmatimonadaceae bacterium]